MAHPASSLYIVVARSWTIVWSPVRLKTFESMFFDEPELFSSSKYYLIVYIVFKFTKCKRALKTSSNISWI